MIGELVIPSKIKIIPQTCFSWTKITKVTLHSNISTLGTSCFYNCSELKEFVIQGTQHFSYSASTNPSSTLTLLYHTPIDPDPVNDAPSENGAIVIVPSSELTWYGLNWPSRINFNLW
jgi:hypothetical protein